MLPLFFGLIAAAAFVSAQSCGGGSSNSSMCRTLIINSASDFCIYGPPTRDTIGNSEARVVAYCTRDGHGTRLIPDGAITGAHFVQTPDYVQVTGVGDLTRINIVAGDGGGELDPHGATGEGNPVGGAVFGSSFGSMQQYHEWTNFVGANLFCVRACRDGSRARALCQHIYDVMGCFWNMPGNYAAGSFDNCAGDDTAPMGVYGTSTFHQGDPVTPPAHPPGATSRCQAAPSPANGGSGGQPNFPTTSTSSSPSPTPTSSTVPSTTSTSSSTSTSTSSSTTSSSTTTSSTTSGSSGTTASSSTSPTVVTAVTTVTSTTTGTSASQTSTSTTTGAAVPLRASGAGVLAVLLGAVVALGA